MKKFHKSQINVLQNKEYDFEISDEEVIEEAKEPSSNSIVDRNILGNRPGELVSKVSIYESVESNELSY
jgi:hypothetical protein